MVFARPMALFGFLAALLAAPALAQPRLELPLACDIPTRCMVAFYVDEKPGPGFGDYRCGPVSYDGHRGTDIRVRTMEDAQQGVAVLAAADGTVVAIRDGEPDIEVSVLGRDKVKDKAGGNLVVIDHGGGWVSQYWHMRKGSIAVARGQKVASGAKLGLVGMSGDASFPHLHFELTLRGKTIDPFTGKEPGQAACGQDEKALWSGAALIAMRYQEVTLVHAGLSNRQPTRIEVGDGKLAGDKASASRKPLNFWYELMGLAKGDRIEMVLLGADGVELARRQRQFERSVSYLFDVVAFDLGRRALAAGRYRVQLTVKGGGQEPPPEAKFSQTLEFSLDP